MSHPHVETSRKERARPKTVFSAPNLRKKALILEDDNALAALLAQVLEAIPCQVTLASDGAEGLRHVMTGEFDVIICDMVMPHMGGDAFFAEVERARPHLSKRFLFMTGHKAEKRWDDFARQKGCVILWKPFEVNIFLLAVREVLKRTEKERSPRS